MNNAAVQTNNRCGPYEHPDRWRRILDTNLFGVYLGGLCFVPHMLDQEEPAVVVNTGSKQGITMPPGDTAYNVSKAGVKVLTEALQHELRSTAGCKVSAFLLVPGCVNTMIRTRGDKWVEGADFKPDRAKDEREYNGVRDRAYAAQKWAERGAWQPEQVIDELFDAISAGTPFYVICRRRDDTRHGRRPYPMGRGRRPVSARAALAMVGRFQNRVCRDRQAVRLRCSSGGDGQRCVRPGPSFSFGHAYIAKKRRSPLFGRVPTGPPRCGRRRAVWRIMRFVA